MVGEGQLPLPEQNAGEVKVAPEQPGPLHITVVLACVQVPEPVQVPVLPQAVLTGQRPCGSARPPPMLVQVPGLPETLQAWQVGQLALPQQTPSTQLPLPHSCPAPHATPAALSARQLPPAPVQ